MNLDSLKSYVNESHGFLCGRVIFNEYEFYKNVFTKNACFEYTRTTNKCGIDSIKYFFANSDFLDINFFDSKMYIVENTVVEEGKYNLPLIKRDVDNGKYKTIWVLDSGKLKIQKEIWISDIYNIKH